MRLRFTVSDADTPSVNFHVYRFYARKRCFRPTVLRSKVLTGLDGRAAQSQEAEQKEQTLPAALHLHHQAEEDAHSGGVTVIPTSHRLTAEGAAPRRPCGGDAARLSIINNRLPAFYFRRSSSRSPTFTCPAVSMTTVNQSVVKPVGQH